MAFSTEILVGATLVFLFSVFLVILFIWRQIKDSDDDAGEPYVNRWRPIK